MNKSIAEMFTGILTMIHFVAFLVLIAVFLAAFFSFIIGEFDYLYLLYALGGFLAYVITVGFLSIVVEIHQNIAAIRVAIDKQAMNLQTNNSSVEGETIKVKPSV